MRRNKKKEEEHHMDESWLLPYSDLLTLLVALFIVLFAMSEIDSQKYEEMTKVFKSEFSTGGEGVMEFDAPPEEGTLDTAEKDKENKEDKEENSKSEQEITELKNIKTKIDKYIAKNNLTEALGTKLADEGLLITILNDVSFDLGSAEVNKKGKKIAKEISELLYTEPPHQVVISGHTDNLPIHNSSYSSNWELSVMRAVNFMSLILENKKLDPIRFSAKGFGEYQPIAPNTNDANRTKNRRVEVLIVPNEIINVDEQEKQK